MKIVLIAFDTTPKQDTAIKGQSTKLLLSRITLKPVTLQVYYRDVKIKITYPSVLKIFALGMIYVSSQTGKMSALQTTIHPITSRTLECI